MKKMVCWIVVASFLAFGSLALAGGGFGANSGDTTPIMPRDGDGTVQQDGFMPSQQDERTIMGTVSSIADDRNSLMLSIDGREIAVNVDQNTTIMDENMNRIGTENINQNDRISVTGNVITTDENGLVTVMSAREISKMPSQQ